MLEVRSRFFLGGGRGGLADAAGKKRQGKQLCAGVNVGENWFYKKRPESVKRGFHNSIKGGARR